MAGNAQAESKQQPPPVDEIQQLKSRVDELCQKIDDEADGNLADRKDLDEICKVLKDISGKMTRKDGAPEQEQELLPQSKREELDKLLPAIKRAFQRRKSPPPNKELDDAHHPAADKKKLLPSCNPFKPRPSPSKQQHKEGEEEDEDEGVSLKLLLRLAQNVLEPEQYYEWTTSYVDESRIYGWDKDADEVADALVAPEPAEDDFGEISLFRAAGIAGVHGSGKTALAQKVFVHDKAKDNFALRLWVCVGPPDSEDRFSLLYRMLDNLGLDTAKVEDIVDKSNAVKPHREAAEARIRGDPDAIAKIRNKAAGMTATTAQDGAAGVDAKAKEESERIFKELLKEEADKNPEVEKSKWGVLLYILHMTLSKTSYMIVFDDIREYGDDGWYRNLALRPPPVGEWGARLGYGLPKGKHRGAVLLTCRNEEHAKSMVRTGRVFHPPKLELEDAWKLFEREYQQAKDAKRKKEDDGKVDSGKAADSDMLLKELREMKEQIVTKCLGLPVAIAEAARGFAGLEPLPDDDAKPAAAHDQKDMQAADNKPASTTDDDPPQI